MNRFAKYAVAVGATLLASYGLYNMHERRMEEKAFYASPAGQRYVDSLIRDAENELKEAHEFKDSLDKAHLKFKDSLDKATDSAMYAICEQMNAKSYWEGVIIAEDGSKHLVRYPIEVWIRGYVTSEDKPIMDSVLEEAPAPKNDDNWYPGYVPDGHVDVPPANIPPSTRPPF